MAEDDEVKPPFPRITGSENVNYGMAVCAKCNSSSVTLLQDVKTSRTWTVCHDCGHRSEGQ